MAISRRSFLYGLGASALLPSFGWSMGNSNGSNPQGYKALICVYLIGGNDGFNMLIPNDDTHYKEYKKARKSIAIPQNKLLPAGLTGVDSLGNDVEFGLHPSMKAMQTLCNKGYVNAVLNCGVLKKPMTKDQTEYAPGMLFSHNSQKDEWLKGNANATDSTGWGGRLMEQLVGTENSTVLPPLFSMSGATRYFNSGVKSNAYKGSHVESLEFRSPEITDIYKTMIEQDDVNKGEFHRLFADVTRDSVNYSEISSKVFATDDEPILKNSDYNLAQQFNSVMKFIKARETLGQNRQIFFVTLDGFDTHRNQGGTHYRLLETLSDSINRLYSSLESQGLESNVTTVTMSDFGRRIQPNASGTDHGWGSNQLVINGGSLIPGTTGTWPSLAEGSDDDYSTGRILPSTSVDQIGATLANWMGVSNSDMSKVFPSLSNFYPKILDFI